MDTRNREVVETHNKGTLSSVVAWVALIIAVIALALAWTAYNNASEENLGDMIREQVQETVQVDQPTQEGTNDGVNGVNDNDAQAPNTNVDDTTTNDDPNTQQNDGTMPENNQQP